MKQSLLALGLANIELKRKKAEEKAETNKKKAMKDPIFSKLNADYTSLMIENAKKEVFGEKVDQKKLEDLNLQMEKRLKELKITGIKPVYSCKKCEDTGLNGEKYCDCLKAEISKILLEKSGFSSLEDFQNSNFEIFEKPEEMQKIYALLKAWCNKPDSNKNLVYLFGETGTGKTHLMKCMANEFIKQNKIVVLTTAFSMSQQFLKFQTQKDSLENLLEAEVLFIDDLGTEPFIRNVTQEYTYLLINERRMRNLKTIITSNLSPMDINERYDERILSRVMDKNSSIVLKISGSDKRLK